MVLESALRAQLVSTYAEMIRRGLNQGTAGNCSVRCSGTDTFLVTPSGMPLEAMTPQAMVLMNLSGRVLGEGKPSSEWRFHRDILEVRSEVNAVVHTHSVSATALACLRQGIPAFHYMVAVAGGHDIRCAPYALFGTQDLSTAALKALENRKACLLANHGLIALGSDLPQALGLAQEVETLAQQYLAARQIGEPATLSEAEMQQVFEQFHDYGYKENS
ncbi:MAG: class II aldolase [Betaproteobacteria bacterium]|nr:class II aldolase [Betaproteobacteria bacterium]